MFWPFLVELLLLNLVLVLFLLHGKCCFLFSPPLENQNCLITKKYTTIYMLILNSKRESLINIIFLKNDTHETRPPLFLQHVD